MRAKSDIPKTRGPLRKVVERHLLTAAEKRAANLDATLGHHLLWLECGHSVVRQTTTRNPTTRCGHCEAEGAT